MNRSGGFLVGFFVGVFIMLLALMIFDVSPAGYGRAAEPALVAHGMKNVYSTASQLRQALNPCLVTGELPDECKKYVINGVLTQPPIKIIIDPSK